jgi:hypothetical protein
MFQPPLTVTVPEIEALVDSHVEGTCECCGVHSAEVRLPVDQDAVSSCWACAHAIVDHDAEPGIAAVSPCACPPREIYPRWS